MSWDSKVNGWSVKTVIGSAAGILALALATLATSAMREMGQAIKDTHDNVLLLKGEVDAIKRGTSLSEAAPAMVEHRLMQIIERDESQILRLEQRLLSVEKEHAEYKRQQERK